jgi:hypothetical protein
MPGGTFTPNFAMSSPPCAHILRYTWRGKRIWQQLHLVLMDVQIPYELLLAS